MRISYVHLCYLSSKRNINPSFEYSSMSHNRIGKTKVVKENTEFLLVLWFPNSYTLRSSFCSSSYQGQAQRGTKGTVVPGTELKEDSSGADFLDRV